jgi:transposase
MRFEEVDDGLWDLIKPFMPPRKSRTGRPRADLRRTFNGVLYVLITGCKWSDVPEKYGAYVTAWRLFRRLKETGALEEAFSVMVSKSYLGGKFDLGICSVDTTTIPAKKGVKQ